MATDVEPLEQNWYYDRRTQRQFQVLAVDDDQGVIDIQNFDGDSDEMTLEEWSAMDLEVSEAPEDFEGAMSNEDEEDHAFGYSGTAAEDGGEYPGGPERARKDETEWARPHGYPRPGQR